MLVVSVVRGGRKTGIAKKVGEQGMELMDIDPDFRQFYNPNNT